MQKLIVFSLIFFLTVSCRKENSLFIWEQSMGTGNAWFVSSAPDSGIMACGEKSNLPFFVKFHSDKSIDIQYSYPDEGLFSSVWGDTSGFIAAGSTSGKLLLVRLGKLGNQIWDTTISTTFKIDFTRLCHEENGQFVAIGTESADSASSSSAGLLFLRFDTAGNILMKKEVSEEWFTSAGDALTDGSGAIYLAVTTNESGMKPRASVAKYDPDFNLIWQTDLYNNNSYSSSAFGIISSGSKIFVTGKTEVAQVDGTLENSFVASLSAAGVINWKKYLEIYNSGVRMQISDSGILMLLNSNCFVIDLISNFTSDTGHNVDGLIRPFDACDSKNTDAIGSGFYIDHSGNIVASGSLGGNFYISVKSGSQ
jgi:hypothetical protein